MDECEKLKKCPFFNDRMANMPATATLFKQRYCQGDNTDCARYMLVQAGQPMPADLFPNMVERAQEIIAAAAEDA